MDIFAVIMGAAILSEPRDSVHARIKTTKRILGAAKLLLRLSAGPEFRREVRSADFDFSLSEARALRFNLKAFAEQLTEHQRNWKPSAYRGGERNSRTR